MSAGSSSSSCSSMKIEDLLCETEVIYVFGYGSLTWKPDFESDRRVLGYIKGYERRFWQGSTYHRGTTENPGRCLTLTKVDGGITWGLVYEIRGAEKIAECLDYLNVREQKLGGYKVFVARVYPLCPTQCSEKMYSVVYQATPECRGFLGDGPDEDLAENIATSLGLVGHNIEYLFRLSDFMRRYLPDKEDDHLYTLDKLVREILGLSTVDNLTWKELLLLPDFKRIVRPLDYKAKWKQVIRANMRDQHTLDRWCVLLDKIKSMRRRGSIFMEKVEQCEFVDIGTFDDDEDTFHVLDGINEITDQQQ